MSYLRWVRLLLAALALQLSTVAPLWAQGELSFTRQDFETGDAPALRSPLATSTAMAGKMSPQPIFTAATVSILLGNGDGSFEPAEDFAVSRPLSITVGDFNGDSQQDLAVTNVDAPIVSIFLGNGDGTFESAQDFGVGEFSGIDRHRRLQWR